MMEWLNQNTGLVFSLLGLVVIPLVTFFGAMVINRQFAELRQQLREDRHAQNVINTDTQKAIAGIAFKIGFLEGKFEK